jgi:hypothetical protein
MKMLMILGGLLGFGIGISLGLARQSDWASMLWRSALAAYGAGLLMRWWGGVWMRSLKEVGEERLAAAIEMQAAAERARKSKS